MRNPLRKEKKVVCFDLDQTLTPNGLHLHHEFTNYLNEQQKNGVPIENKEQKAAHAKNFITKLESEGKLDFRSDFFKNIVSTFRAHSDKGNYIAITSFNAYEGLVDEFTNSLATKGGLGATPKNNIEVFASNPSERNSQEELDYMKNQGIICHKGSMSDGKNYHIEKCIEKLEEKTGSKIKKKNVILIDDSITNIDIADKSGYNTIHVDDQKGFSASNINALDKLTGVKTNLIPLGVESVKESLQHMDIQHDSKPKQGSPEKTPPQQGGPKEKSL